ncbi:hypothetical protein D3C87_144690 [compost metagenome]
MKTLFFSFLFFASPSFAVWEKLAEVSYRVSNQECPPVSKNSQDPACEAESSANKNIENLAEVQENVHLSALAEIRHQALTCASTEFEGLTKNPEKFETWARDAEFKIKAMAEEAKTSQKLYKEISGSQRAKKSLKLSQAEIDEKRKLLQEAEGRYATIFQSIPFSDLKEIQKLIIDQTTNGLSTSMNSEKFREELKKIMGNTARAIKSDMSVLQEGIQSGGAKLGRSLRESLAQDLDLTEALKARQGASTSFASEACRIDAKYGKGAETRDNILMAGSLVGAGLSVMLPRLATAGLLGRAAAGAAAGGNVSVRSALIYRSAVAYLPAGANAAAFGNEISKSCLSNTNKGTAKAGQNQCSQYSIQNLESDNCILEASLAALGGGAALAQTQASKKLALYVSDTAKKYKEAKEATKDSFLRIQRGSPKVAEAANRKVLDELNEIESTTMAGSKRKVSLSKDEIQAVSDRVKNNPVTDLCALDKYDPEGFKGFCYGRAMATHIEALKAGVDKDSIRKVWAVGEIKGPGIDWDWHVATVVKGADGKWWAVDSKLGNAMPVEQWYAQLKKYDQTGNMRIFTSEAQRFLPINTEKYTNAGLHREVYGTYFNDLIDGYKAEAKEIMRQRNNTQSP